MQGRHSPQIGAKNRPHSQWQKVMYFPNLMLKNSQLHLQFDIQRLSETSFLKQFKNKDFSKKENIEFLRL